MKSRKFWMPLGVASAFLAGPAWSDTKELGPEAVPIEAPALVSSRGNVEQRSGAASFIYDFELPPGRDGLTPSLRLSYSSNRGNAWVGRGFYLDTPLIRRDTRDGVPRYDSGDRFVLESGDGVAPLVPWGAHALGQEYRAARDSEEVQYILRPDGTWLVRRRDGVEELFSPSVHALKCLLCSDSRTMDNTFAWRLSQVRDRNDNVIDYAYESALPDVEQAMRMPRLSEIWYGGNDRVGLPHVFHVVLARDHDPSPPAALSDLPAPRHDCKRERGREPLSFAAGGMMRDPDGVYELLRGVAVEIAWPGSTHEGVVAREARRVRTWQLGYNWDDVGCFAARHLWPQLTSVHERGYDDHGGFVERPAVTFDYYGWERTLTRVGDVPLPPATRLTPWGRPFFRHGLLVSAPNGQSDSDHFRGVPFEEQPSVRRLGPPGLIGGLLDVDSDGRPDFLDLAANRRCFLGHPNGGATEARYFRFLDPSRGFAPARAWPFDNGILYANPGSLTFGDRTVPLIDCGLEFFYTDMVVPLTYGNGWHEHEGVRYFDTPIQLDQRLVIDVDGDGYLDLLRYAARDASGVGDWFWHRNETDARTGEVRYGGARPYPLGRWVNPHLYHVPLRGDFGDYYPRPGRMYPEQCDGCANPPFDGRLALSARFAVQAIDYPDYEHEGVTWTSSQAGHLADFTGDGIPDRLVAVDSAENGDGALVLYRGRKNGGFADGETWLPALFGPGTFLSPHATISPNRNRADRYEGASYDVYTTDVTIDLNGDGLLDIVSMLPELRSRDPERDTPPYDNELWTAPEAQVLFNHGNGFTLPESAGSVRDALAITRVERHATGTSPLRINDEPRLVRGVRHVLDYDGDHLPDVIDAEESRYYPNFGGGFGPAMPIAPGSWETVALADRDQAYTASRRFIGDVTGDGRPDMVILQDGPAWHTPSDRMIVYSDADGGAAPGRLRRVRDARGAEIRFSYSTIGEALGDAPGIPAIGYVVERVEVTPAAGETPLVTTFRYSEPRFGADPALRPRDGALEPIARAPSFRGFDSIRECLPNGAERRSTYTDLGVTEGLLRSVELFGDCSVDQELLRRVAYVYNEHEGPALVVANDVGERYVRPLVRERTDEQREAGYSRTALTIYEHRELTRAQATLEREMYYGADGSLLRAIGRSYAPFDPQSRASYLLLVDEELTSDASALLSGTAWSYDERGNVIEERHRTGLGTSDVLTTTFRRNTTGHVELTTSPAGRERWSCYDRYQLYPVLSQDALGHVVETVTSYVHGNVLREDGPLTPAARIACSPIEHRAFWESSKPVPLTSIAPREQGGSSVLAPSVATQPGISRRPATSPAPIGPPSFNVQRERPPNDAGPMSARFVVGSGTPSIAPPALTSPTATPLPARSPAARWFYDGLGRLRRIDRVERDPGGALVWVTDEEHVLDASGAETYEYRYFDAVAFSASYRLQDGLGRDRYAAVFDPAHAAFADAWYEYGSSEALDRTIEPSPDPTRRARSIRMVRRRDQRGRPLEAELADGEIVTWSYSDRRSRDPAASPGLLVRRTLAGEIVEQELFDRGAIWRRYAAAGTPLTSTATLDGLGRVVAMEEPDGSYTTISYDLAGRTDTVSRYGSRGGAFTPITTWVHRYDADGAPTEVLGPTGSTVRDYDSIGRLRTLTPPSSATTLRGYGPIVYAYHAGGDAPGELESVATPDRVTRFVHDTRRQVIESCVAMDVVLDGARLADEQCFEFEYDRQGNRRRVSTPLHGIEYTYDLRGQLVEVSDDTAGARRTLASLTRNLAGLVTWRSDDAGGLERREYDMHGRPRVIDVAEFGADGWFQTVTYNTEGHPRFVSTGPGDLPSRMLVARYDGAGRLIGAEDDMGYFLRVDYREGRMYEVEERVAGASTKRRYVYAAPSADPAALSAVVDPATGVPEISLEYDASGAMTARRAGAVRVPLDNDPTGRLRSSGDDAFLYDVAGTLTHTYDAETGIVRAQLAGVWDAIYERKGRVFSRVSSELVARIDDQLAARVDESSGAARLVHQDVFGNVVRVRDEWGGPGARFDYTPFGAARLAARGPLVNEERRGYGAALDAGLSPFVWMGVRVYDRDLKRFVRPDPVMFTALYAFANDNPLSFQDPSGTLHEGIATLPPIDIVAPPPTILEPIHVGGSQALPLSFPEGASLVEAPALGLSIPSQEPGATSRSAQVGLAAGAQISAAAGARAGARPGPRGSGSRPRPGYMLLPVPPRYVLQPGLTGLPVTLFPNGLLGHPYRPVRSAAELFQYSQGYIYRSTPYRFDPLILMQQFEPPTPRPPESNPYGPSLFDSPGVRQGVRSFGSFPLSPMFSPGMGGSLRFPMR